VIEFPADAEQQLHDRARHYLKKERFEALRNLRKAVGDAAPPPSPQLAQHRRFWLEVGRYGFADRTAPTLAVIAVFFETANIPKRFQ
jgi:hypothetical protein